MNNGYSCPAPDLTRLQRRRVSWHVAKLGSLKTVVKRAGIGDADVEELQADESFTALLQAYRSMLAMPADERHRRLVEIALQALEEACFRGDNRAMLFILEQTARGHIAAKIPAKGVVPASEQPPVPRRPGPLQTQPPARPPATPREPSCPADNAFSAAGLRLRRETLDEGKIEPNAQAAQHTANSRVRVAQEEKSDKTYRGIDRPLMAVDELTPEQAALIAGLAERDRGPAGSSPETVPKNPNAPNQMK